ncbi:MAG: hypothetical protein ACKONH_09150, partial [Planctomycetia bacterium]
SAQRSVGCARSTVACGCGRSTGWYQGISSSLAQARGSGQQSWWWLLLLALACLLLETLLLGWPYRERQAAQPAPAGGAA